MFKHQSFLCYRAKISLHSAGTQYFHFQTHRYVIIWQPDLLAMRFECHTQTTHHAHCKIDTQLQKLERFSAIVHIIIETQLPTMSKNSVTSGKLSATGHFSLFVHPRLLACTLLEFEFPLTKSHQVKSEDSSQDFSSSSLSACATLHTGRQAVPADWVATHRLVWGGGGLLSHSSRSKYSPSPSTEE